MKAFYQQSRERYNRDREHGPVPDMETGHTHAISVTMPPASDPFIATSRFETWQAICGRRVKVVLRAVWDEDAPDACARCAEKMRTVEYGDATFPPNWTGRATRRGE